MVSLGTVLAPVGMSFSLLMCYSEHIVRLKAWTYLVLISLCHVLELCYSFKGCALPPSLLFQGDWGHRSPLSPQSKKSALWGSTHIYTRKLTHLLRTWIRSGLLHTHPSQFPLYLLCWNLLLPLLGAPGGWPTGQHQWAPLSSAFRLDWAIKEPGSRAEGRRPARVSFYLPALSLCPARMAGDSSCEASPSPPLSVSPSLDSSKHLLHSFRPSSGPRHHDFPFGFPTTCPQLCRSSLY